MKIKEGLTFDDVLLVPKRSSVKSRKDVDVSTKFSRNVKMKIPIVSANMDTVTESEMAVALAQEGGIGIIHRFMTVKDQVKEVERVKRSEGFIIENPYTVSPKASIAEANEFMKRKGVSGLVVVEGGVVVGIITSRDIAFEDKSKKRVSELMTKKNDMVVVSGNISLTKAKKILHENKIEKLPIVDDEWYLKGLITAKDIKKIMEHPNASKDRKGRLVVGVAIGVKDYLDRTEALVKAGVDVLVVDVAHGHSSLAINAVKNVKKAFPNVDVVGGNVATKEGTKDLIKAGADAVKVGIGPGSICITRIVAGAGVPQLTAIADCSEVAKKYGIPIIADGGIRTSGDVAKALAAGASSVMIGSLFAGTKESPGVTVLRNGGKYKISRGMASLGAAFGRDKRTGNKNNYEEMVPEGVEAMVPFRGSVTEIINQLVGGLKSGISYCGAKNIKGMQKKAEFVRITKAGLRESGAHDVRVV